MVVTSRYRDAAELVWIRHPPGLTPGKDCPVPKAVEQHSTRTPTKPSRPRARSGFRPVPPAATVAAGFPHGGESPSSSGTPHGGVNPASGEVPPIACPALAIGAELGRVATAYYACDEAALAADQAGRWADHNRAETRRALLQDRMENLEDTLTFTPAATLEGALVQVMLAAAAAGQFLAFNLTEDQAKEEGERLVRLLYSIRGAIEAATGSGGIEAVGEFYMRAEFNPFLALNAGA